MAGYIEREAVSQPFDAYTIKHDSDVYVRLSDVSAHIQSIPNADVVEVVRCKDCKYYHLFQEGFMDCRHSAGLDDAMPDDFCSYGERRSDAGK